VQYNKAPALPGKVLQHPIRAAGDQIRERTALRCATNTAGAWKNEEQPSSGSCANSRTEAAGWKEKEIND